MTTFLFRLSSALERRATTRTDGGPIVSVLFTTLRTRHGATANLRARRGIQTGAFRAVVSRVKYIARSAELAYTHGGGGGASGPEEFVPRRRRFRGVTFRVYKSRRTCTSVAPITGPCELCGSF